MTNKFDRIVCVAGWHKLSEDTCEGVKTGLVFVLNLLCIPSSFAFTDAFLEQAVSYQQFADNPALIDDPNLVVKIGNK